MSTPLASFLLLLFLAFVACVSADEDRKPRAYNGQGAVTFTMEGEFARGHPPRPRWSPESPETTTMVLIASYRDWRCGRSLFELFDNARWPDRTYAGVVDQRMPDDDVKCLDEFCRRWTEKYGASDDCPYRSHVFVHEVHALDAKGPCVARAQVQRLLDRAPREPTFSLLIDAHSYFLKHWDWELQYEWNATENEYAVLTTYAPGHADLLERHNFGEHSRREVPHLCRTMWGDSGLVRNQQASAAHWLPRPKLTNLWGAGLSFAKSHFERRVPYDPHLAHIFDGEEYSRQMRAVAAGYDSYTPSRNIIFHDYTPVPHFWTSGVRPVVNIEAEKLPALVRLYKLFRMGRYTSPHAALKDAASNMTVPDLGIYGTGLCRTFEETAAFTGVDPSEGVRRASTGAECGQLEWRPYDEECHRRWDEMHKIGRREVQEEQVQREPKAKSGGGGGDDGVGGVGRAHVDAMRDNAKVDDGDDEHDELSQATFGMGLREMALIDASLVVTWLCAIGCYWCYRRRRSAKHSASMSIGAGSSRARAARVK